MRSNTGSPHPGGQPRTTQLMMPPTESPALRAASMRSIIRSATVRSGQRTIVRSTSSRVRRSPSHSAAIVPTRDTQATIATPQRSASNLRAIAPPATRPAVSRALVRPPPRQSRMPYLAS